jgi:hypothetical protein
MLHDLVVLGLAVAILAGLVLALRDWRKHR